MEEVEVMNVQKLARTTTAETVYVVLLSFESPVVQKLEKDEGMKAHVKLDVPGVPERAPSVPFENKAVLYLNENEWDKCKNKFIVGAKVSVKIEKNGSISIG